MFNSSRPYLIGSSPYVCQFKHEHIIVNSKGLFSNDNPLGYSVPLLLLQLSVISLTTFATSYILRPLGQSSVVSQILAGVIIGPSVLGNNKKFRDGIFPNGSHTTLETIATFGVMFFLFQLGVKVDPGMVKQSGQKSIVIGILVFLFPFAFSTSMAFILKHFVEMDRSLSDALPMIAASQSLTGFIVIACHLTELKIINTDLGRLAMSSSMVGDLIGITVTACSLALQQSQTDPFDAALGIISTIGMVVFILYVMRPLALWMIKQIPAGEPVKEIHIFTLFVSILIVGFMSEAIGQHFVLGPLVLGLALPEGPPLGADVVEKLDSLVSFILFPTYLAVSGLKTNVYSINPKSIWIMGIIIVFAFLVKVLAAVLPCLYCHMPWREALVFGLTLNVKGIVELLLFNIWMDSKILKEQEFALAVIFVILLTAIISPLMRALYDPSKRFISSKKSTIQHAKLNAELHILVSIHKQDIVPSILNLIEITHPTVETPISVVVLQLVELVGRSAPILVPHQPNHNYMCGGTRTQNIVNAFKQYEMINQGLTSVLPFTAIAHFATMHDDICNLALDKKVNIVITPFHKDWGIDGQVESENRAIRAMNCNLLEKAPCSVGILVDRNILSGSLTVLASRAFYRVAVVFMGGSDDAEALAFAARMAEHPQVSLTVIRFLAFGFDNARDRKLDNDVIDEFKNITANNPEVEHKEVVVRDGEGIAAVIRDMGNSYDLVLVGRHHRNETQLLSGLSEWNECPELGIVGDMLASSDFKGQCSVLVVQQAKLRFGMRNGGRDTTEEFSAQDEEVTGPVTISVER